MVTWILTIVILAAFVVIFSWVFAKLFGRGEPTLPMEGNEVVIEHNRQAVGDGRIDDIMFETVIRGYRQDQVDDVIEHLRWQIDALTTQLDQATSTISETVHIKE